MLPHSSFVEIRQNIETFFNFIFKHKCGWNMIQTHDLSLLAEWYVALKFTVSLRSLDIIALAQSYIWRQPDTIIILYKVHVKICNVMK